MQLTHNFFVDDDLPNESIKFVLTDCERSVFDIKFTACRICGLVALFNYELINQIFVLLWIDHGTSIWTL